MSLTPISKESMQRLKAAEDEEYHNKQIADIVSEIYNNAIKKAKTTTETSYYYEYINIFNININTLLNIIQGLFTDCLVSYTVVSNSQDEKMNGRSYIIIDWS